MKMRVIKIPNNRANEVVKEIRKAIYAGNENVQFMISQELYQEFFYGEFEGADIPFDVEHFCDGWWHITELIDIVDDYKHNYAKADEILWMQYEKEESIQLTVE